jgi:hypothetical protein
MGCLANVDRYVLVGKYAAFYFESLEDADKFVMEADDVLPHNLPEVLAHAKGYFLCAGAIVKKQGIFNVEEGTCSFTVTLPSREYLFIGIQSSSFCTTDVAFSLSLFALVQLNPKWRPRSGASPFARPARRMPSKESTHVRTRGRSR